jgi:hypothetical protein
MTVSTFMKMTCENTRIPVCFQAMIRLRKIRDLHLNQPSQPGRLPAICAASGLVVQGNWLYVVADDENHLGVLRHPSSEQGELLPLFPSALPLNNKKRKKKKPDLEALCLLAPELLLTVPSGSKPNRVEGKAIRLRADGKIRGNPREVDFAPLYERLGKIVDELNIEGACVREDRLLLFQRGNGAQRENALFELNRESFAADLMRGGVPSPRTLQGVRWYDLGELNGAPLSFTDASPLPQGGIAFTAAAEQTESTYDDGACEGSVIGVIGENGRILFQKRLPKKIKAEGIHVLKASRGQIEALIVNDEDDISRSSELYRVSCKLAP